MKERIEQCSVVVVGAGISGLAAAEELSRHFPDVVLVEASDRIGGRIKQVEGVLPWPVELGPQFIHGSRTSLQGLINAAGCKFEEYHWPDYWYFKQGRKLLPASAQDADISAVNERFESVGRLSYPAEDISAEAWLREGGANERMIDIAEACYANDFGCSLSQMGMRETIHENRLWNSGEEYLVLNKPLSSLAEHLRQLSGVRIMKRWQVRRIQHRPGWVIVSSSAGQKIVCRHVVITVPIKILQRGDIHFEPPLPLKKQQVIERIQMSNALKIVIALDRPIWPEGFFDVVCPGGFIPEFWVTRHTPQSTYNGPDLWGITGFVAGKRAEELSNTSESAIVQATLSQLDDIFGVGPRSSHTRFPATNAFVRAHIADWSKEPFILGAYSYPSLGAEIGDRDALAESISGALFFAGEATHPAVNPCLQAAYETGKFAAQAIVELARKQSKL